jgi:hypothetical protein
LLPVCAIEPKNWASGIATLELKLQQFKVSQYVSIGSHIYAMFVHKKFTGARRTLTTFYRTLCVLLFGCLLALYGSIMHPAQLCGDHFFYLVCGLLEKKKKEADSAV